MNDDKNLQRVDELEGYRRKAFQISKSDTMMGRVLAKTFTTMSTVVDEGPRAESLVADMESLVQMRNYALQNDRNSDDPLRSVTYGMSAAICSMIASIQERWGQGSVETQVVAVDNGGNAPPISNQENVVPKGNRGELSINPQFNSIVKMEVQKDAFEMPETHHQMSKHEDSIAATSKVVHMRLIDAADSETATADTGKAVDNKDENSEQLGLQEIKAHMLSATFEMDLMNIAARRNVVQQKGYGENGKVQTVVQPMVFVDANTVNISASIEASNQNVEQPGSLNQNGRKTRRSSLMPSRSVTLQSTSHFFSCSKCDKQFPTQRGLNSHHAFVHDGLQCVECKLRLKNEESVRKHYAEHHPGRVVNAVENEEEAGTSNDGVYIVEKVVQKREDADGKLYYLVKWVGWGPEHNSWVDKIL